MTLRKGMLPRDGKPFRLPHQRFFLYPTFEDQPGDLVRESHQPELRRALEEGVWSDGEPALQTFVSGAPLQQPDRVRIRAWAEVTGHFTVLDPRCVDALSPFYVWSANYAEKRLRWRGGASRCTCCALPNTAPGDSQGEGRLPERLDRAPASSPSRAPRAQRREFERGLPEIRITTDAGQPVLV